MRKMVVLYKVLFTDDLKRLNWYRVRAFISGTAHFRKRVIVCLQGLLKRNISAYSIGFKLPTTYYFHYPFLIYGPSLSISLFSRRIIIPWFRHLGIFTVYNSKKRIIFKFTRISSNYTFSTRALTSHIYLHKTKLPKLLPVPILLKVMTIQLLCWFHKTSNQLLIVCQNVTRS